MSRKWDRKEKQKHEKKVMQRLGFTPTVGSGNQWWDKEDGKCDAMLAQLKATKLDSQSLKREDIRKLMENAALVNKTPVFVMDYCGGQNDDVTMICFPEEYALILLETARIIREYEDD